MLMGSECCGSGVDLKNEVSKCSMHEAMLFWDASILQVEKSYTPYFLKLRNPTEPIVCVISSPMRQYCLIFSASVKNSESPSITYLSTFR
jgi:hypothetical protein